MGLIYPILRRLKIDLKRKLVLFGLFSLGIFSLLCNVGRSIALLQPPYVHGYFWATAETTAAIVCASIPAIRPLFDKKRWVGRSTGEISVALTSATSKTPKGTDSDGSAIHEGSSGRWKGEWDGDGQESCSTHC